MEYLVKRDLINPSPSPTLEHLYAQRVSSALKTTATEKKSPTMVDDVERSEDKLLLQMSDAKQLASILDAPELALEAERAIIQVEQQLNAQHQSTQGEKGAGPSKKET